MLGQGVLWETCNSATDSGVGGFYGYRINAEGVLNSGSLRESNVNRVAWMTGAGGAALTALALMLSPAIAAQETKAKKARPSRSAALTIGSFTPAIADPRLAAEFARRGSRLGAYRFTPSAAADKNKSVRVAVRASTSRQVADRSASETSANSVNALTPVSYNLGVAVGWKRFAISGDVAKVRGGPIPGEREVADIGVSYSIKKFTGRVEVGTERSTSPLPRIVAPEDAYSVDVGGSYSIARNVAVTAGARYRIQRDRLEPLADDRRDSQSVYVGTAFRF